MTSKSGTKMHRARKIGGKIDGKQRNERSAKGEEVNNANDEFMANRSHQIIEASQKGLEEGIGKRMEWRRKFIIKSDYSQSKMKQKPLIIIKIGLKCPNQALFINFRI